MTDTTVSVNTTSRKAHVSVKVDIEYQPIATVMGALAAACNDNGLGADEATLSIETYEEYGSVRLVVTVEGTRKATAAELKEQRAAEIETTRIHNERLAERDEQLAAEIRARRPDLFTLQVTEEP